MKYFVIIAVLLAAKPGAIAQRQVLKANDIFGSWIFLDKSPEGFRLEDHCDKSELIISENSLIFAFEFEKHDTLLVKNIQLIADTVSITFFPNKFEFTRISAHWFDFHKIMLLSVLDEDSSWPLNIYLTQSSKRSFYTKGLEPCPDVDATHPSFELLKVD